MSDIWFCCKKTDKVVELSDCLECKEPKNCLSLASYQQGRADAIEEVVDVVWQFVDDSYSFESFKDEVIKELKEKN